MEVEEVGGQNGDLAVGQEEEAIEGKSPETILPGFLVDRLPPAPSLLAQTSENQPNHQGEQQANQKDVDGQERVLRRNLSLDAGW